MTVQRNNFAFDCTRRQLAVARWARQGVVEHKDNWRFAGRLCGVLDLDARLERFQLGEEVGFGVGSLERHPAVPAKSKTT